MPRRLALFALFSLTASAQIWPEVWYGSKRTKAEPVTVEDRQLWSEYQGEAAETAGYNGPVGKFSGTAWRLKDSTSAMAWYQALRPDTCVPERGALLACTTPGAEFLAHDNYVLKFEGWRPLKKEMAELYGKLPGLRSGGGLPVLPSYLPVKQRLRNSERYVVGLQSLEKFLPGFPATLAGLEDGAEAQVGRFSTTAGEATVAVFYFHTPQLARAKATEIEKLPGWVVRRSGPIVGVVTRLGDGTAVASVFDGLEYKANAIWDQATKPPPMPNVGGMLVAIFELTGVLLVACVGGGLLFAFVMVWYRRRRFRIDGHDESFTVVQLGDR